MDIIERAAIYAIKAHEGQRRKIKKHHYFYHPMEVAFIAEDLTEDDDVVVAALLHDVLEECKIDPHEIEKEFGTRVMNLVLSETEKEYDMPKEASWRIRKEESIKKLKESDDLGVKILFLSDKLSNIRSLYRAYMEEGDACFNHFHNNNKADHYWYYKSILDNVSELKDQLKYQEYKQIIERIFEGK